MTSLDAKSDYGTDIEITSEYGSEFDPEEETLIANLLTRYAASAPRQKTVVYAGTEEDGARPTVFIHSSPPSAFVRLQEGAAVELEAGCAVRNAAVEVLCDSSPRRFSNSTIPFLYGTFPRLTH
jgi:exonuclease V